jgi:hypothetical protein
MSISPGKKSVLGPATTTTDASAGTAFCCASTTLSVSKLSFFNDDVMVLYPVRSLPSEVCSPCPCTK